MSDDDKMAADRQAALQAFRRLLEDEKDLYIGEPPDERIMIQNLKFTNYNADEAFEHLKTVFRTKSMYREFFCLRRDPELHDVILQRGSHQMLDYRDQLGRRIYLLRMNRFDFGTFQVNQVFQVDDLWCSLAVDEEETQDNGIVMLLDMDKVPWSILKMFSPYNAKAMTAKTEIIPIKNVQFHVVNAGYILNVLVGLVYPFLSQATKDSIHIHKSLESLHEHISPSALPREYGGQRPSVDTAKLVREYLDSNHERLSEILSYGYRSKIM